MEILIIILLLPIILMLSTTDGSALTTDIEMIFYYADATSNDEIQIKNKGEEGEISPSSTVNTTQESREQRSDTHTANNTVKSKPRRKEEPIVKPPPLSSNFMDTLTEDSDNLGKNPHSKYKY